MQPICAGSCTMPIENFSTVKDRFEARRSCPCLPTAASDLRCSGSDAPLVTPSVHPFTAAAENALTVPPTPPARAGSFHAPSEPFPLADAMTKMGASPREAIGRRG
jgi:hypothetical protein